MNTNMNVNLAHQAAPPTSGVPLLPTAVDGAPPAGVAIQPAPVVPKTIVLPAPKREVPPPLVLDREVRAIKHESRNVLAIQVKSGAGVLYSLLNLPSHAYEAPDVTWLQLLEAIALIPSGKPQGMVEILAEVYRIMPLGEFRNRFQSDFRNELYVKSKMTPREGLVLKDKVNRFLRAFMADPIQGYVLSKTHIHDNLYADDVVQTPVGLGYVRAYRPSDHFYTVLFPWGHGFIHERCVRSHDATTEKRAWEQVDNEEAYHAQVCELVACICKQNTVDVVHRVMKQAPDSILSKEYVAAQCNMATT